MKKLLIYYNFLVVTIMVIAGISSASTIAQLVSASIFCPLSLYFFTLILPKKNKAIVIPELAVVPKEKAPQAGEENSLVKLKKEGVDIDRRMFLKLIGSAGASLFLLSIFTKKAQAAFFGSMPGPGTVAVKDASGNLINPSEKLPTDGYRVSKIDDSTPSYYGFVNKDGDWFIMKEDPATGEFLYHKKQLAETNLQTVWANRNQEGFSYGYFDSEF